MFVIGEFYLRNFQQKNFNETQEVHIYLKSFINALIRMNVHRKY